MTVDPERPARTRRLRWLAFAVVCLTALAIGVVALSIAWRERARSESATTPVELADTTVSDALRNSEAELVFRSSSLGESYGSVAAVPVTATNGPRAVSDLRCDRVDYRDGLGVCLRTHRGLINTFDAVIFDDALEARHTISLPGIPSRTRVGPGGTIAATTVFVSGHSYADGSFSTLTNLIDPRTGRLLADLEVDFTVLRDGTPWSEVDFNFWGVTFVDDNEFYATLGTGGDHYLVAGNVDDREMRIVTDGVECPSLSPDGSRVAFKSRRSNGLGPVTWQLAVLDLATLEVTELAETRNVDDQVAWFDDRTVMYGLPTDGSPAESDTWVVPADGSGSPRQLLPGAWSTAVVP